jgi:hypothetical protein
MVVPQAQQADWRPALPADPAPRTVPVAVPVIASGTEAIRVARKFAASIAQAPQSHHVGNYLLNGVLPPNHGQI